MKTILLPTDFSDASRFASEYIFKLNQNTKVNYHLIHSYDPPSSTGALISIDDIVKKDAEASMIEEIEWMVALGIEENRITSDVFFGEFNVVVNREAKKVNADYIVLGTTGASGLKEIIGSNASNLIKSASVPVFGIPLDASNDSNGKILFPVNLSEETDFTAITLLNEFASINNVTIEIFYASVPGNDNYTIIEKQKLAVTDILKGANVEFTIEQCENVSARILELIDKGNYSMLAMMPHKYGILKRLFTSSLTSKIAMKTSIPLLGIH